MSIKEQLLQNCQDFVTNKLQSIESTIKQHKESLLEETKATAGDKHEVGRAMVQLEIEKSSQQIPSMREMQKQLDKVNLNYSPLVRLGSLVETTLGIYFIAISSGVFYIDKKTYYAVSTDSPIGKLLLGTKMGDEIYFKSDKVVVKSVI